MVSPEQFANGAWAMVLYRDSLVEIWSSSRDDIFEILDNIDSAASSADAS